MEDDSVRIDRATRPQFRGIAGRRILRVREEQKQRDFEALAHTMFTCGTLWAGFWFQFVISFMYNHPAIHTLSMGNWFAPHVEFYLPIDSPLAVSLAESFAGLSVFGSVLALLGVWHWTRGVRGRWRMRALVAGFAGFLSLWSLAALAAEDAAWQSLEDRHSEIQRELRQVHHAEWIRLLRSEKAQIERMLETRPNKE
jgi:hypothetical protein